MSVWAIIRDLVTKTGEMTGWLERQDQQLRHQEDDLAALKNEVERIRQYEQQRRSPQVRRRKPHGT